jgi:hypothetical protein
MEHVYRKTSVKMGGAQNSGSARTQPHRRAELELRAPLLLPFTEAQRWRAYGIPRVVTNKGFSGNKAVTIGD